MSVTPSVFGISMALKARRRWLVLLCYAILAILLLLVFSALPISARFVLIIVLNTAASSVQFVLFYKLAQDTVLPQARKDDGRPVSLGLLRNTFSYKTDLDERQIAVRNAAYHKAYRVMAVCWLALMPFAGLVSSNKLLVAILLVSLYVMLTLPQAIILWTEPDIPEEA